MYLSHYNLAEKPFQITTDPKFLWLGEKHKEALATLKYGIVDNKGFLLLTGDVGTGKTTLINTLLRDLDSNTIVATVVDPDLEKLEFFNFLASALGIEEKFTQKVDFLAYFREFLNNAYLNNKKVLLIIDEAQRLSTELLEEILFLGYLFNPSGYNDYILSPEDYYNDIFGSDEGSSSKQQTEKIPAPEPQQPPIYGPVSPAAPQESMTDTVEQNSLSEGEEPMLPVDLKLIIPFNININELSPKAYGLLDRLAAALVQNHNIKIVVTGYTDTLGGYHYNKKLSEFRANIVKSYLTAKGISPLRIQIFGMGEKNPLEPNTSAEGRYANRRVEIELHAGSWD